MRATRTRSRRLAPSSSATSHACDAAMRAGEVRGRRCLVLERDARVGHVRRVHARAPRASSANGGTDRESTHRRATATRYRHGRVRALTNAHGIGGPSARQSPGPSRCSTSPSRNTQLALEHPDLLVDERVRVGRERDLRACGQLDVDELHRPARDRRDRAPAVPGRRVGPDRLVAATREARTSSPSARATSSESVMPERARQPAEQRGGRLRLVALDLRDHRARHARRLRERADGHAAGPRARQRTVADSDVARATVIATMVRIDCH